MTDRIDSIAATNRIATSQDPPAVPAATKAASGTTDSVTLSPAAQATLLKAEGQSVNEIALELGLPASTVLSDLGLPR